jgi:2-C-methyl-D-erythritol 2,4-cyclodiphosphate synthase
MNLRIGQGWDSHRLIEGRPLVIGGVTIPHDKGEDAHSDGDVLIHALVDAMLGALALGDIGTHFPPSDPQFKNADSRQLLALVCDFCQKTGFRPVNVDTTVILERPRLANYIDAIRNSLSQCLGLAEERVSVKAKSAEGLDSVGRGEAIQALACVLMEGQHE